MLFILDYKRNAMSFMSSTWITPRLLSHLISSEEDVIRKAGITLARHIQSRLFLVKGRLKADLQAMIALYATTLFTLDYKRNAMSFMSSTWITPSHPYFF